jgi:hypothetical protein
MGIERVTVKGFKLEVGVGKKLQLTEEQAGVRMHSLTKLDGDMYLVDKIVEFKCGEEIGIAAADIPKIDLPKTDLPEKQAKAKAPKEAKAKSKGMPGNNTAADTRVGDLDPTA